MPDFNFKEIVYEILKMLLMISPFILMCFLDKLCNLPKIERSKQFLMPVIGVILMAAVMFYADDINSTLINFIRYIPKFFFDLEDKLWMPKIIGDFLINIGNKIKEFLDSLNLDFWIFFVSNWVILGIYVLIKKGILYLLLGIYNSENETYRKIHETVTSEFYEFFPERDKWCVKNSYSQARGLIKFFWISSIVISVIIMLLSRKFYDEKIFTVMFYPVFGVAILGELYFFLDGLTKREYTQNVLGEDENAYKNVNYSLLRKFLRSVFKDKLLAESTNVNNAFADEITTNDIIAKLEKSDDPKVATFASFMDALNKSGFEIDNNYLNSSLDLLNGKSILFNNPFYNDHIPYAFYPMNRALLNHKKVLIILGRHSVEDDIAEWVERGIESVTNIPFMWRSGILNDSRQELDIGIMTRSDVLNIKLHEANADFLEKVEFCVILEPSKLISTAQIGLNLIIKKCRNNEDKNIVFCMFDKNCDGLVDAMSHILMTSISEVSATSKHLGTSSYMAWEADDEYVHHRMFPNISRYLGMGTELSFAGLKNQVSKATWFGGEAFPVTDINWIDRQYYYELMKYSGLPTTQEAMDERFKTTPNYWSATVAKHNYFTVEDESCNMFEILREFQTRSTEQGFINVISPEYLLKDYMADNASIFEADPKAIPYIVADYARTERNVILRLILMMSTFTVPEESIIKEFSLIGIKTFDLKKQLWHEIYKCYADTKSIASLPSDYKAAVEETYSRTISADGFSDDAFDAGVLICKEKYNMRQGKMETVYAIEDREFISRCVSELKSAGYVTEDEKGEEHYLGAELSGHIYQKYLPGQFFTFGGKYYEMQYLTADGQVLIRRAADHIYGRPAYRQIRDYEISGTRPLGVIGSSRDVAGMKVVREYADIRVKTPGYYRMNSYKDFATAEKIIFDQASGIPERVYNNKEILRIELPSKDGQVNDDVRYTMTVLFNEVFKTLFADNQPFITAVTCGDHLEDDGKNKPLTVSLNGVDGYELSRNSIYIIEDSQLDLGLTVAVERNLRRIFGIIQDYLSWHASKLGKAVEVDEEVSEQIDGMLSEDYDEEDISADVTEEADENSVVRASVAPKIRFSISYSGGIPPVDDEPADESDGEIQQDVADEAETAETVEAEEPETQAEENGYEEVMTEEEITEDLIPEEVLPEEIAIEEEAEQTEAEPEPELQEPEQEETVVTAEPEQAVRNLPVPEPFERADYSERNYLRFGSEDEIQGISIVGSLDYLTQLGFDSGNPLKRARNGKNVADRVASTYDPSNANSRFCDFCGSEIIGVEYETLVDGRDRCMSCGRTAIKTEEEFKELFEDVKRNMESFFGIKINAGIRVEMVNSKALHKRIGKSFVPTTGGDGRVLGVAISDKNGFSLLIENGSPRMSSMLTMAHELTHIWQYINWQESEIADKHGKEALDEIYEGMAKWVEVQYAYLINEPAVAKREEIRTLYRNDVYGKGFVRFCEVYPFSTGTVINGPTPFSNVHDPLDPSYSSRENAVAPADDGKGEKKKKKERKEKGESSKGNIIKGIIVLIIIALLIFAFSKLFDKMIPGTEPSTTVSSTEKNDKKEETAETDSVTPKVSSGKFYYNLLSNEEKAAYDAFSEAVFAVDESISTVPVSIDNNQWDHALEYFLLDNPQVDWLNTSGCSYSTKDNKVVDVEIAYYISKSQVESRTAEIEKVANAFVSGLDKNLSEYEKALAVFEYLVTTVDYDSVELEKSEKNPNYGKNAPDDLRSVYGTLKNKKVVCAGYAATAQYLFEKLGMECVMVTGEGKGEAHGWNLVKIDGNYYYMDATWGDLSNTDPSLDGGDMIRYEYFTMTTAQLLKEHTLDQPYDMPVCTDTVCNYFSSEGYYLEEYDLNQIKEMTSKSVKEKSKSNQICFSDKASYDKAEKELLEYAAANEIVEYVNSNAGTKYTTYSIITSPEFFTIGFNFK